MQGVLPDETPVAQRNRYVASIPIGTLSETTTNQINGHLSMFLTEYPQSLNQQDIPVHLKECEFLPRQSGNELP